MRGRRGRGVISECGFGGRGEGGRDEGCGDLYICLDGGVRAC